MTKEKRLLQMPKLFKKLYIRAKTGRSQASAIRSQCIECMAYQYVEVEKCTDTGCQLFEYRITGRKTQAKPIKTDTISQGNCTAMLF